MPKSSDIDPIQGVVHNAVESAKASDQLMKSAIEHNFHRKLVSDKTSDQIAEQSKSLLESASPHHISHNVLRRIERNKLSVHRSISFRSKIHEMSEARRLGILRPSWKLDAKNSAYNFVDAIGARRPKSDKTAYRFSDLPEKYPSVIKATRATGSRGCYLLFNPEKIVHVRDNKTFSSWDAMSKHAKSLMSPKRSTSTALPDRWMTEELILEDSTRGVAARNLKFYCFYGEVSFIQESRREPDLQVTFYTPDNEPTITGRYEDLNYKGVGVTPSDVETVQEISRQIPFPFMRIDMLNDENGIMFGEFTPRPGNFDELNDYWDRNLGEAWVRAEYRLYRDLLEGKSFKNFLDATHLLD